MAARKKSTSRKESTLQESKQSGLSSYFRFTESYTSLVVGIVVVIIAVILLIAFLRGRELSETPPPAPEITSTETSTVPEQGKSYTVQEGDDLWQIAEEAYGDGYKWTEIAQANNLTDANVISAGDVITIPDLGETQTDTVDAPSATPEEAEPTEAAPSATGTATPTRAAVSPTPKQSEPTVTPESTATVDAGEEYTVKAGDHLWKIAEAVYGDGYRWVEIARVNNLDNPDVIHVGNVLVLPE